MKIKIEEEFGGTIAERGYGYYREGRVSNLLKAGDVVTATVEGTHRYNSKSHAHKVPKFVRLAIIARMKAVCTAAVCYGLNSGRKIKSVEAVEQQLGKRSKE